MTLGPAVLLGVALAAPAAAVDPAPLLTTATSDPAVADAGCTDQQVTVVVDLTDLGGEIEVGCGDVPATGTEVLLDAGFVDTRDPSGFICAINSQPDPCPTEFTGSFWSYWSGEPGGEWQAYAEGSDTSTPAAGSSEGWRYNDGSEGPGLAPAAAPGQTGADSGAQAEASPAAEDAGAEAGDSSEATEPTDTQDTAADQDADQETASGPSPTAIAAIALVVLLVAGGAVIAARRRSAATHSHGPTGQD